MNNPLYQKKKEMNNPIVQNLVEWSYKKKKN